ncbi:M23 family metallopeptidase [Asanoa sp. WMMD1127]|uniref:murein hydrolase activator EnvC family protein n=1 Tax=Asanoa sp. WMMD1127 TaxID=3016107 RepID=UPI002416797E|nr:M23 family metallopeptidase [Asanoa sp. WMMD1127]MDG4823589.1 M23 family metallopeptidase [Asanoa sp. WMMD1127]
MFAVVVVAVLVPVGPARSSGRYGSAVAAAGVGGLRHGVGVRGDPAGMVLVSALVDRQALVRSGLVRSGLVRSGLARSGLARPALDDGLPSVDVGARGGRAPGGGFRPPVEPPLRVTRRFDAPAQNWLPGHRGVDLASAAGATVWAAGPGVVAFAGPVAGRSVVSIDHPGGLRTTYEPLVPVVRRGDRVATGDPIGMVEPGHPECAATACLHWGLRRGEQYLNPLLLLGFRVRLLPL